MMLTWCIHSAYCCPMRACYIHWSPPQILPHKLHSLVHAQPTKVCVVHILSHLYYSRWEHWDKLFIFHTVRSTPGYVVTSKQCVYLISFQFCATIDADTFTATYLCKISIFSVFPFNVFSVLASSVFSVPVSSVFSILTLGTWLFADTIFLYTYSYQCVRVLVSSVFSVLESSVFSIRTCV